MTMTLWKWAAVFLLVGSPGPLPDRVYLFTSKNCGSCRRVAAETLPALRRRGVRIGEENGNDIQPVDCEKNPDWVRRFGIESIPAWVKIRGNVITGRRTGFLTADEYLEWAE